VVTKFYKNTSWVISDKKSDYILNHEQLHFDLAEVYSRKYRKALQAAKLELGNMQQAETIFNRVYSDFVKRQERYDNETEHGINTVKQGEWNAIIEIELAKYDLYKKPNQKI
jgi:predicted secreted Zn-dependent protease